MDSPNYVQYGNIRLNIVAIQDYKREPIYADRDKTHYLYTRHTLSINATVFPDPGMFAHADLSHLTVVEFDAILRHHLTLPRQLLTYVVGGFLLLGSPILPAEVDCTNGPKVLHCSIKKVNGLLSASVDFTIQTDLNETLDYGAPPYKMLSNSYSMEHIIDHDFYTTRKINGIAHFRADFVALEGKAVDGYREMLNLPSPVGFKRDMTKCRMHPDGNKLEYSFLDREVHYYIDTRGQTPQNPGPITINGTVYPFPDNCNITRIEIRASRSSFIPTALGALEQSGLAAAVSKRMASGTSIALNTGLRGIAKSKNSVEVSVYGNNYCNKKQLEYVALLAVEYMLPYCSVAGAYNIQTSYDVVGSFLKIAAEQETSLLAEALNQLGDIASITEVAKEIAENNGKANSVRMNPAFFRKIPADRLKGIVEGEQTLLDGDLPGVVLKTYTSAGMLNPWMLQLPTVTARSSISGQQMRGSFRIQLFVESLRRSLEHSPLENHKTPPIEYGYFGGDDEVDP